MTTEQDVKALVQREIDSILDSTVKDAIVAALVPLQVHNRYWLPETHEEPYICWTVAEHPPSNIAYVYCEDGFINAVLQWGIVWMSSNETCMDSNWFTSLERAFYDSFLAADLPIWNLIRVDAPETERIVANSLVSDEAWRLKTQLDHKVGIGKDGRWPYDVEPRGYRWS